MPARPDPSGGPGPAAAPRPLHTRPLVLVLVGAGGFLGTICRWGVGRLIDAPGGWPLGTLVVNLTGALALGLLLGALAHHPDAGLRRAARLGLGTGFCGAFTTYSALAVETVLLAGGAAPGTALGYLCVSVIAGLVLARAGVAVAGRAHRGRRAAR